MEVNNENGDHANGSFKTPSRLDLAIAIGNQAYGDAKAWGWSDDEAAAWKDIWAGGVFSREQTSEHQRP
jgi:hypothetical protein